MKDWTLPHSCDDDRSRCLYCGCCQHTPPRAWCKANDAPEGTACPESGCGCEGRS